MTVKIEKGFQVEIDQYGNYKLVEVYQGLDKDGNEKEQNRVHGYFKTMNGAVKKIIRLELARDESTVELSNYLTLLDKRLVALNSLATTALREIKETDK